MAQKYGMKERNDNKMAVHVPIMMCVHSMEGRLCTAECVLFDKCWCNKCNMQHL